MDKQIAVVEKKGFLQKAKAFFVEKAEQIKKAVAVGVATLVTSPVFASIDVSSVVSELNDAKTPVAAVAGSTVSVLVVRRVWKMIKSSI